jgi:hypothetical protein
MFSVNRTLKTGNFEMPNFDPLFTLLICTEYVSVKSGATLCYFTHEMVRDFYFQI